MGKQSFRRTGKLFGFGFIMGAADIVPGVSGGTMAFILGIYEELLSSIRAFASGAALRMLVACQLKKAYRELPWPFLVSLGSGILCAILLLSSPIKYLLENRPVLIWAFFFGLVLASIFTVLKKVEKWNASAVVAAVLGAVGAYYLVGLVPAQTPNSWYFIIFCGALAISAMILPGISGSFILVLLNKYDYILCAVHNLKGAVKSADFAAIWSNAGILVLFCIGIVIGISVFVRVLQFLFRKYHDATVAGLIGFMAGSLRKVWPFKNGDANTLPQGFDSEVGFAILLAVSGLVLVILIEAFASRKERTEQQNGAIENASDIH